MSEKRKREDEVENAVSFIFKRDEDENLLNPYLNEFESKLFLKLSSHDCVSGEFTMESFEKRLKQDIFDAISRVTKEFNINDE